MKYTIYVVLIVVVVAGALWYLTEEKIEEPSELQNKNSAIAFDALPEGYEKADATLFRRGLAKPSGAKAGTRFTKIDNSGIDFNNFFDRSRPVELLDTGSGVAIGDYDGDGLNDVYLVGSDIPNRLYRNLGNFQFEDVTGEANVDGSYNTEVLFGSGASFADVDNDGDLDLFLCNMAAPNMLYINQGDGTFDEQANARGCGYVGASKSANFCDFDQDGDLDFCLVTYQDEQPDPNINPVEIVNGEKRIRADMRDQYMIVGEGVVKTGESDILYRNKGDGTFEEVTKQAGLVDYGTTLASVWFDYDRDGWQDIYVSNDFHAPDRLYRNNGDGTFSDWLPYVVKHTPWFSMGNDAGDLNNDGWDDLITADMSGTSHYRRKIDMGDMGDSSFFLTYGEPRQYMKNALYINSGTGKFFEMASMAGVSSTDWTWASRMVDLDNDGRLDLFFTNGNARDIMNADITGEFESIGDDPSRQHELESFYLGIPSRKEKNLAFRNLGDLEFEPTGNQWGLDHNGVSHGAAFSDLDNDGDLDLIINNYYEPSLVYRNDSTTGSRLMLELRCNDNNFYGVGARVEIWQGDKYQSKTLRSSRGYLSSDAPMLHFGCDESNISQVKVTWPDNTYEIHKDLKPGFVYRIVESENRLTNPEPTLPGTMFTYRSRKYGIAQHHKEKEFDDFQRENLLPYKLSELGAGLAWSDVNNDGELDVFCGGAAGQAGQLFVGDSRNFHREHEGPWSGDTEYEDMGILFFDFDGDGDDDLYVVSGGDECEPGDEALTDRLYENQGDGTFKSTSGVLPDLRDSGSCALACDFDRDGDLDLFVGGRQIPGRYPETPKSRLLENQDGKFRDITEKVAPSLLKVGLVNSAIWSDIDNDGWSDLVIALEWGPVTVFRNEQGKLVDQTKELKLSSYLGWWHGIAAADLDDDGDMDFVVTNQGLNTKYHVDQKHPHRLYYSDFDNSGTLDLVETEFEGDIEYPARGRSCSSNSMPFIAEKFPTYHDFATASLTEIYEPSIREKPFSRSQFFRVGNYLE